MVEQIESKDYKVLTKDEYEAFLAFRASKGQPGAVAGTPQQMNTPVTSTPQVNVTHGGTKPKVFPFPGPSPVPRLQQLLANSQQLNTSYIPQTFNPPKLPFFSGKEETSKGETTYEVWSFEVKCLQNSPYIQEPVLLQSIRNSLKGSARSLLVPLGENATVTDIINKLDGFYGNVSSGETLIQTFYNDFQKESESIVEYGSRLEQTLSRAIKYGHIDFVAKDAMLRSKFWTGLRSQQLKNSTRHLYDSVKDFQSLLREVRKVEQEDANSNRPVTKQKTAQQHNVQVSDESSDMNLKLSKQMDELMSRMKAMESKLESQQQKTAAANKQASFQPNYYRPQSQGNDFGRGSWRGGYGRGNSNYKNNQKGQKQQTTRRGNSRGGYRGGTFGRGANGGGRDTRATDRLN